MADRKAPNGTGAQENWYLPYIDKKTRGEAVEERDKPVAIFYCAGASNVGQSTATAAKRAARKLGYDRASLLCLASISAGLPNVTRGAREASGIVAIDGCPMSCAKRTLEKAGFTVDEHVILTRDANVKKNFRLDEAGADSDAGDVVAERVVRIEERVKRAERKDRTDDATDGETLS